MDAKEGLGVSRSCHLVAEVSRAPWFVWKPWPGHKLKGGG